mmetsp:Transcript_7338/g.15221  ORF Transcript_7338/g.15221 Transcript_7338/m.15221 type:complete len:250 (-) Transcript_7338:404-1153(-)
MAGRFWHPQKLVLAHPGDVAGGIGELSSLAHSDARIASRSARAATCFASSTRLSARASAMLASPSSSTRKGGTASVLAASPADWAVAVRLALGWAASSTSGASGLALPVAAGAAWGVAAGWLPCAAFSPASFAAAAMTSRNCLERASYLSQSSLSSHLSKVGSTTSSCLPAAWHAPGLLPSSLSIASLSLAVRSASLAAAFASLICACSKSDLILLTLAMACSFSMVALLSNPEMAPTDCFFGTSTTLG